MNNKFNKLRSLTLILSITFSAVLSGLFFSKGTKKEIVTSAYNNTSIPETMNIDLNYPTDASIRNYYSALNSLPNSEKQGENLLKNLKPILKNGQKYHKYDSSTNLWRIYEIAMRDWEKSPASEIQGYNSATNTISNYSFTGGTDPYVHAFFVNRNVDNQTVAREDHSQTNWGINREHIWPNSLGYNGADMKNAGARGDPMSVMAANGYANNIHSNNLYGFVDKNKTYTDCGTKYYFLTGNLSGKSKTLGGNDTVFEPQDSDKGDIARAVFYMVARYNYLSGSDPDGINSDNPNLTLVQSSTVPSSYYSTTTNPGIMGIISDLLAWHHLDPVDEVEIKRNNLLYTNFTSNRNPFVDFPEWVDYIWGTANLDGTNYSPTPTGVADPTSDPLNQFATAVAPTSITLNATTHSMEVGNTFQASVVSTIPADASKSVNWSVQSGGTYASVSATGLITGLAAGSAVIKATSTLDPNVSATISVTVTPPLIPVSSVTLNKNTLTLETGANETLIATVLPNNATNKNVTWSTDNGSVATVDSTGKVTAVSSGTATITVTSQFDSTKKDTCVVTVNKPVTSVTLNKNTLSLEVGGSETLIATVLPTDATNKNVIWSTSNNSVATVNSAGLVNAVSSGTATITATSQYDGTKKDTCVVTVTAAIPDPTELLTGNSPYLNGVAYKMYFVNTQSSSTHYFSGSMSGYYGTTTTTKSDGVDVYFEKSGTGQNIYFFNSGVKNYFKVTLSGSYKNFTYQSTVPEAPWYYSEVYQTMTYTIDTKEYTFGTYETYTTFGAFMLEQYPDNYKVQFETTDATSATPYSNAFLQYLICNASGTSAPGYTNSQSWASLKRVYMNLDSTAKNQLLNANSNPNGTDVEKAMARYDYIVGKYGTASFEDFIGRNPAPISPLFNYQPREVIVRYGLGAIVIVVGIGMTFFYIRTNKKKEQ